MENLKKPVEIRLRFEAEGHKITLEEHGESTTAMVCHYRSGKKAVLLTFASVLTEQERRLLLGQY